MFSLPAAERVELMLELVDRLVELEVDPLRDGNSSTVLGRLVSIASPATGAQCELAVVRTPGRPDRAMSLATIRSAKELKVPAAPTDT